MSKKIKKICHYLQYKYITIFDSLVKKQRKDPRHIPIIIINFNQLETLKQLVSFLLEKEFRKIVIIDNNSTYPPLMDYYKSINGKVTVERMHENHGHMVFFKNRSLLEKYAKGYYVVTDADISLNPAMPKDFMNSLLKLMDRYHYHILKAGLALDLETIPDYYPLKEKVKNWEAKFWSDQLEEHVFKADIDTTFALYKPNYPLRFNINNQFYKAVRIAGKFTCKHMGWYLDPENLTAEQLYYMSTSSISNSWKFDEEGKLKSNEDY